MRRLIVLTVSALFLGIPGLASAHSFPDVIALPTGFFPEGIAVGDGSTFFTGSLVNGDIYRGDLRSGEGVVFATGPGTPAVGMNVDRSAKTLWVAGGPTGDVRAYSTTSGDLIGSVSVTAPFTGFVNDVIVTGGAVYATDSFQPQIYEIPIDNRGHVAGPVRTIPLGGDFQFTPGQFNATGIEATRDGGTLIVVNSFAGEVYKVNPITGDASLIDLGGTAVNGDGLVLVGKLLYAVVGSANAIFEIELSADLTSGNVTDVIGHPAFNVPTTAARFGDSLYAVNAKFGTPPAGTPYEAVRISR